jgi:CRISPR-associated endonuclease/helicase Cas3
LTIDQFSAFFQELHGHPPYSWQTRLAKQAVAGNWPGAIDLPTGSGKTACIDVAIFALACQAARPIEERNAPRRIFFCVNRRVIVDEAFQRARWIAKQLLQAEGGKPSILRETAAALRRIAGTTEGDDAPPLDVLELRGGIYRDNRWARSAAQPTVICTTIDQLGSRLLFRGYGVSHNAAPIQAALIAYDTLVLLDEAHISQPFFQTLREVHRYLDPEKWAETPIGPRRMIVVPMTATPPPEVDPKDVIRLDDADCANASLNNRIRADKWTELVKVPDVTNALVKHAAESVKEGNAAVGIIVNRVATAKAIHDSLREKYPDAVELVIGSMRPIDRDEQSKRLAPLVGPARPRVSTATSFIVATQCLEVGADYDFDVLLTECASLDALRQRFGRLNRAGRDIDARAVIVVKARDIKPDDAIDDENPLDPIYGNAQARTWNWLWDHAEVSAPPTDGETTGKGSKGKAKAPDESRSINFGIDTFKSLLEQTSPDGKVPQNLFAPSAIADAPVMLPAHVDFWCQTAPIPVPDPDIALFLHGKPRGEPDVQICWRADLNTDEESIRSWADIVALVPPSSAECMGVPFSRFRRWFMGEDLATADRGDAIEVATDVDQEQPKDQPTDRLALIWRGSERSEILRSVKDLQMLRPGDTIVLPEVGKGWDELGHIPSPVSTEAEAATSIDVAEDAFLAARDRRVLRLHSVFKDRFSKTEGREAFFKRIVDPENPTSRADLRDLLETLATEQLEGSTLRETLFAFARGSSLLEPYPDGKGLVLTSRQRLRTGESWFLPALDDGDDSASRINRETPISLDDHTRHVREAVGRILTLIHTSVSHDVYATVADRHDWGKADDRFQAILLGTSRTDAWLWSGDLAKLLAKSDGLPRTASERKAARERAGLPDGFRHEMLSVQLAEAVPWPAPVDAERDLVLHLIAAHHGHARPFAPTVIDPNPPDVELAELTFTAANRKRRPPHRLDSGVADRFWSLTRRHGWWGLAYLEALLRLADQQASALEDAGKYDNAMSVEPMEATR